LLETGDTNGGGEIKPSDYSLNHLCENLNFSEYYVNVTDTGKGLTGMERLQ
jgi:hypothetical protein